MIYKWCIESIGQMHWGLCEIRVLPRETDTTWRNNESSVRQDRLSIIKFPVCVYPHALGLKTPYIHPPHHHQNELVLTVRFSTVWYNMILYGMDGWMDVYEAVCCGIAWYVMVLYVLPWPDLACHAGVYPINGTSIELKIRSSFAVLWLKNLFNQSQRNFAHVAWHVKNCCDQP